MRSKIFTRVADLATLSLFHRPCRPSGTREMVVHPNSIDIYHMTDTAIIILRILHSARNWH